MVLGSVGGSGWGLKWIGDGVGKVEVCVGVERVMVLGGFGKVEWVLVLGVVLGGGGVWKEMVLESRFWVVLGIRAYCTQLDRVAGF